MADTFTPYTFTHPDLGPLTGRLPSSTSPIAYSSISFAHIPARFRQSTLLTSLAQTSGDFTQFGTACPAPPQDDQTAAAGGPLPGEEARKFDEFSCLNLTIAAPRDALGKEGKGPPVVVYMHGGALGAGAGRASLLYGGDTTELVDLSIREGQPVVIDLIDEAKANNEPPSNFGLYDQRIGFQWIHRFISGFGCDPNRITAFGESAGAGSIALHMSTSVPLFNRAILMSGTAATGPTVGHKYEEAEFLALLGYCSIDEDDSERLRNLRDVPVENLVEAIDVVGIPLFESLRTDGLPSALLSNSGFRCNFTALHFTY